jgi:hypothetical protein
MRGEKSGENGENFAWILAVRFILSSDEPGRVLKTFVTSL